MSAKSQYDPRLVLGLRWLARLWAAALLLFWGAFFVEHKACSLNRDELEAWAAEETGSPPGYCDSCQLDHDDLPADAGPAHLTMLGGEILDYVLDAALIHMENELPPYRLTVSDIAACFGKTPGQISPVLHQLINDSLLTVLGKMGAATTNRRRGSCCQRCSPCEHLKRFRVRATVRSKTSWPILTWHEADTRQAGFFLPAFQR